MEDESEGFILLENVIADGIELDDDRQDFRYHGKEGGIQRGKEGQGKENQGKEGQAKGGQESRMPSTSLTY